MRNFAVPYNLLWTRNALENFTGTFKLWAVVNIPQFVPMWSLVMQIHHWSAITPQIYCITERMLILMLKTHLNHNIKNFRPHFELCVLHQRCLHLHPKAWNLLFGIQYFYSGLALWIKYCVTSDPCGFTLFFLSFPSRLFLPGGWFSFTNSLSAGIFSTPGKNGKYLFFFLYFHVSPLVNLLPSMSGQF